MNQGAQTQARSIARQFRWAIIVGVVILTALLKYDLEDARHRGCCYGPDDFDLKPGQSYIGASADVLKPKPYPRWKYTTLGKIFPEPSQTIGSLMNLFAPILAGGLAYVVVLSVGRRKAAVAIGTAVLIVEFAVPLVVDWGVSY